MKETVESREADAVRKWCSSQERSTQDVREKLRRKGLDERAVEEVVAELQREGYLDEQRFADAFVRARAEHKSWGPAKIRAGLRAKGVDAAVASRAMEGQRDAVFAEGLERLIQRRAHELPDRRDRVIRWLISRGFGLGEILAAIQAHERTM